MIPSTSDAPPSVVVSTRNYRALRNANWNPIGVNLLVGPNGSGKTTLLNLLSFFRDAFNQTAARAVDRMGGVNGLRTWGIPNDEDVKVSLAVNNVNWELELVVDGSAQSAGLGETVTNGTERVLSREPSSNQYKLKDNIVQFPDSDERVVLRRVVAAGRLPDVDSLVGLLREIRIYRAPNISNLQANGSKHGSDLVLNPSGNNVFTVLRNWRDRRDTKPTYQFVIDRLQQAFPEVFSDLDFHVAGMTVAADVIEPRFNEACPLAIAPDGLVTGLLHLTAAAGAVPGSLIAIDDFGNDLHPYAIRKIVEAFRELADQKQLTICLASHSPVLLDEFKDEPSSVWVMEHGFENRPVRLTDLFDEEWLSRFSLGQLYEYGEFGGQLARSKTAR